MVVDEIQEIDGATFCESCYKPCAVKHWTETDVEPYGERRVSRVSHFYESECCEMHTSKYSLMNLADILSDTLAIDIKVNTHESKECSMVFKISTQEREAFIYLYNGDRFSIRAQKLEYVDDEATDHSKATAWIYDWCEGLAQEYAEYFTENWTEYQCRVEDNTMKIWWRL
jgi:hypothetical protein